MTSFPKCQAANPAACTDPQCPEKRGIQKALDQAANNMDFNAFLETKAKEESRKVSSSASAMQGIKTPKDFVTYIKQENPEVKFYLSGNEDSFVVLDTIVIPKGNRKSGVGSKIMSQLVEVADKNGWQLALTPSDSFGSSKNRLEVFYRRFGFVKNSGRNKDYATMESMIRPN